MIPATGEYQHICIVISKTSVLKRMQDIFIFY